MRHKYANVQQLMPTNEDFLIEIKVQRPNMSSAKWTFDIDTVQITVSLCNLQSRPNIFPHQKWLIIGTQQARAHKHIKGGLSTCSFSSQRESALFSRECFLSFFFYFFFYINEYVYVCVCFCLCTAFHTFRKKELYKGKNGHKR